ncbi:hypothetical protein [Brachybacterium paraconglomeratum]|uniref:hypothetical protein n=1 Tax=Brachybacterium paraconglomeratum TaxID=173362 RepID=UPI0031EDA439
MAQGRDSPTGYDWEDHSDPSEPASLALPDRGRGQAGRVPAVGPALPFLGDEQLGTAADDSASVPEDSVPADIFREDAPYGAPSFTYEPQEPPEEGLRRVGLPAWAIVAIVIVQAAALVAVVGLVVGGLQRLGDPSPAPPVATPASDEESTSVPGSQTPQEREPGTVTDSAGREMTDGTGGYDRPATLGEHTVSWTAWTDGTLSVTPLEVDLAATAPGADGKDVVQDGYRLVLVTYEVRYDGPGQLAPAEELWLTGESDRTYLPDVAEGLVPDPMTSISPLGGGESARFRSAFLVSEKEVDTFRLGVETFSGELVYFTTG